MKKNKLTEWGAKKIDYFKRNVLHCVSLGVSWLMVSVLSVIVPLGVLCDRFGLTKAATGTKLALGGGIAIIVLLLYFSKSFNSWVSTIKAGALRAIIKAAKAVICLVLSWAVLKYIGGTIEDILFVLFVAIWSNAAALIPRIWFEECIRTKNAEDALYEHDRAVMQREERIAEADRKRQQRQERKIQEQSEVDD